MVAQSSTSEARDHDPDDDEKLDAKQFLGGQDTMPHCEYAVRFSGFTEIPCGIDVRSRWDQRDIQQDITAEVLGGILGFQGIGQEDFVLDHKRLVWVALPNSAGGLPRTRESVAGRARTGSAAQKQAALRRGLKDDASASLSPVDFDGGRSLDAEEKVQEMEAATPGEAVYFPSRTWSIF
ncbi:hypothetical protein BDW68DRAFT_180895 [Aspergillus falconensis]